ncbi:S-adenosyl-L-methionine-dependent tRNA 4-demethylwyosine synthase TYW1-like [Periplaneta americana]|uniref:S-adenosyl-L-methionine-dependent tRNA 4-demethylwyosine synthase TYW1-like n=1 Tax=Periplaneta americana TaxID=6978 RepID=UPI0037E91D8A
MLTILGIPLIGHLFVPTLVGVITVYVIWFLSTRKKVESSNIGDSLSVYEDSEKSAFTLNSIDSKPKRKVFGNKSGFADNDGEPSVDFNLKSNSVERQMNKLPQQQIVSSSYSKRKVFSNKQNEQLSSLSSENGPSKRRTRKKRCKGKAGCCSEKKKASKNIEGTVESVKVFYATISGSSEMYSSILKKNCEDKELKVEIIDLDKIDPEEKLLEETSGNSLCLFVLPTYTDGKPPESAVWFCKWLEEATNDFRIEKELLKGLKFAVFGLCNSEYNDHFNQVGKQVDEWLGELHASRLIKLGVGDEARKVTKFGTVDADFEWWNDQLWKRVDKLNEGGKDCQCNETEQGKSSCDSDSGGTCSSDDDSLGQDSHETGVIDLEELGTYTNSLRLAQENKSDQTSKEMVTAPLRESLTKQGYRIVGTHSGVKLCRWTKSMLRGRGGCYKHTFYGIESHRCMETTPSLACANKCVFCWRHHSNPVGTEWRWKMDPPEDILKGSLDNHYNMIKQFKGVPGVLPERFAEGMDVKHCALSLVGEPIMYPEINNFVTLLHSKSISTFLVTNAQFPKELRDMSPVTQLYVSVDASTKSSLRKIDRPLFKDFWERFIDSLRALSEKGQRTVYRLTLVKAWNVEEMADYAKLVDIGNPDFIEVKGVTYCGTSKASTLSMENVPWHEEVMSFVKKLADLLPNYEIASEHEHSNCVLIAHKKFQVDGEWWTWIDYDKFQELVKQYYETGGKSTFTAEDYMCKTPRWAVYGSTERGFDPVEKRWHRKSLPRKDISGC